MSAVTVNPVIGRELTERLRGFKAFFAISIFVVLMFERARLASGEHWPLDVLGGYVLGATAASAVLVALQRGSWTAPTATVER